MSIIDRIVRAYGVKRIDIRPEPNILREGCAYCGGTWKLQVVGTINGRPVFNAECSVCGMTTKDFEDGDDLIAYLNRS
jgi:hypothetical protein